MSVLAYMGYYYYDVTYLLVILGAVLSMIASAQVNSTFKRYSRVRSSCGMTGAEAAERILYRNGLSNVRIEHISGNLTDHYDPSSKVLRLSDATYNATSVAAVGVAAHECGHAVQDAKGYAPLKFRSALVPAANFGSKFGLPIFVLGLFLGSNELLMQIGIWVFLAAVLFQIVTLPVEFDASHRAMGFLTEYGILSENEAEGSRRVLRAAAMTYVAAAAAALLNLLRLVMLSRRDARRDCPHSLKRVKRRKRDAAQPETCETPEKRHCADEKEKAKQLSETAGHCALSMENRKWIQEKQRCSCLWRWRRPKTSAAA